MKKLTIILLLITTCASAQKLKEIDSLNYKTMIDKTLSKDFRTGMDIQTYFAIDKNSYKVNDTLVLGVPSGINTNSIKVMGNIHTSMRYEYLFYGKPAGVLLKGVRYVEANYRNYKVTIEKIQFQKGQMGYENYVFFYVKPLKNTDFTLIDDYITITMVDKAIERGEIIPLYIDRPITREEAIEILKKKKEELDLDIISQEEYDKFKNDLMPIIKS